MREELLYEVLQNMQGLKLECHIKKDPIGFDFD